MQMKKIIAGTSALALSLSMTSVAFAQNATPVSENIQLNVEVLDTLSMNCYDSEDVSAPFDDTIVTLGNSVTGAGMVTAGVPSIGKSKCDVTTNDDEGYYLTIINSSASYTHAAPSGVGTSTASTVLAHEDNNVNDLWYDLPDLPAYTFAAGEGNAAPWDNVGPTVTKGLGFSVIDFPEDDVADLAHNSIDDEWVVSGDLCQEGAADDDALYAGVPASALPIAAVTSFDADQTTTEVCYKVDVESTQESGVYAGQVTFTATSDASTYFPEV